MGSQEVLQQKQTCRLTGKRSTSLDFMSFDSFKSIIIFTSLYTFFPTVEPLVTDTSLIQTPVYYIQFPMSWQNSHIIIFFKKNLYDTDSL